MVYFLGYDNHEEVLKTDLLPITDANHMPINNNMNYQSMQQQGPPQTSYQPTQQQQQQQYYGNNANFQRNNNNRYRERPVYMPPHKRDN